MGVMAEIRGALADGTTREQLEAAGYKRSSVYLGAKQLAKSGRGPKAAPAPASVFQGPNHLRGLVSGNPESSSALLDKREELQIRQLDNALTVEDQKADRLRKPEPGERPSAISELASMGRLIGAVRELTPAPVQPMAQGGLSSEGRYKLELAKMDSEEYLAKRKVDREADVETNKLEATEAWTKVGGDVMGVVVKGVAEFLANPGSAPALRQPVELNPNPNPGPGPGPGPGPDAGGWSAGGTWTAPAEPEFIEEDDMQPEEYGRDNVYRPAEVPGQVNRFRPATQSASAMGELSYVERRNLGLLDQRPTTSRPIVPHNPNPPDIDRILPSGQKGRFYTGKKTYVRGGD